MYGYHFPMGGLTGLMILVVIAIVVYRLIKGMPEGTERKQGKTAGEILDERYASGEIDKEEYEQKKQDLRR